MSLTNRSLKAIPALKMEEWVLLLKVTGDSLILGIAQDALKGLGWLEALTDIGALQCQLYHPLYYLKFFTQSILFIFPLPQLLPGPPLFPISLPPNFQLHACFFFLSLSKSKKH